MMKKIFVCILVCIFLFIVSSSNATATLNKITIIDEIDDIIQETENDTVTNVIRPDIDVYKLTCEQDNREVIITLQLRENGTITKSNSILYSFILTTTHNSYEISFGNLLSEFDSSLEKPLNIGATNHFSSKTTDITDGDYNGVGTDKLTITFTLLERDERMISCNAMTMDISLTLGTGYMDDVNFLEDNDSIFPIPGGDDGVYKAKVGEAVNFEGSLEDSLQSENYEWLWVIVNEDYRTTAMLDGQNPQHTFGIPGNYKGKLFVYNDEGLYGEEDFEIEVSGEVTNGGSQKEGGPTGSLTTTILIMAIIVIIGVAVVLLFIRRL